MNEVQDAIQRYVNKVLYNLMQELTSSLPEDQKGSLPFIRAAIEKRIVQFEEDISTSSYSSKDSFPTAPIDAFVSAHAKAEECAKSLETVPKGLETVQKGLEEKKLTGSFCTELLKSGSRKGSMCMKPVVANGKCGRHGGVVEQKTYGGTCEMIIKSGARANQPCGAKTCVGESFCARHKKKSCCYLLHGKPCGQPLSDFSPSQSYCRIHIIQELSIDTSTYTLMINSFKQKEHKWSGMIFDDSKVIGKKGENGLVDGALNDEDLRTMIYYKLPPDPKYFERMSQLYTFMIQQGEISMT